VHAGCPSPQAQYPATVVRVSCPNSAPGVRRPAIGSVVPAHYTEPAIAAGLSATAWVASVHAPPAASAGTVAAGLAVFTVTVDCGAAVGFANLTCAIDASTGVPLDVSFACPALQWIPSCGWVG